MRTDTGVTESFMPKEKRRIDVNKMRGKQKEI